MANCTPVTMAVLDANGNPQNMPVPPPLLVPIQINASGGFPVTLEGASAGNICRLYRLFVVADGDTTISFLDGATGLFSIKMIAGETVTLDPQIFPWAQGTVNTDFKLQSTNAVQLTGCAWINLNPS